jgi:hypothetical protein
MQMASSVVGGGLPPLEIIIGASAGGAVLLIAIVVIVCVTKRRRRRRDEQRHDSPSTSASAGFVDVPSLRDTLAGNANSGIEQQSTTPTTMPPKQRQIAPTLGSLRQQSNSNVYTSATMPLSTYESTNVPIL